MNALCTLEYHNDKLLNLVCTNPNCQNHRLFCSHCLRVYHRDCLSFILDINDINKRSFSENIEWIQDPNITKAILNIEKNQKNGSNGHLFGNVEDLIHQEFTKLTEYIMDSLQEIKRRVFKRIRASSSGESIIIDEFTRKLKRLYNFDSFLDILEPLRHGVVNMNTISRELNNFFIDIDNRRNELAELQELAQRF